MPCPFTAEVPGTASEETGRRNAGCTRSPSPAPWEPGDRGPAASRRTPSDLCPFSSCEPPVSPVRRPPKRALPLSPLPEVRASPGWKGDGTEFLPLREAGSVCGTGWPREGRGPGGEGPQSTVATDQKVHFEANDVMVTSSVTHTGPHSPLRSSALSPHADA